MQAITYHEHEMVITMIKQFRTCRRKKKEKEKKKKKKRKGKWKNIYFLDEASYPSNYDPYQVGVRAHRGQ